MPPSGRIKTRYVGVYVRHWMRKRYTVGGNTDKCFDIHYRDGQGKYVWEKVGWLSEGYTVEDAVRLRGERVKARRHPELVGKLSRAKDTNLTLLSCPILTNRKTAKQSNAAAKSHRKTSGFFTSDLLPYLHIIAYSVLSAFLNREDLMFKTLEVNKQPRSEAAGYVVLIRYCYTA